MSSDSSSDNEEFFGVLFPVFCTVDIPPQILDLLIARSHDSFSPAQGAALCVLKTSLATDHDKPTRAPNIAFTTPFAGKSLLELADFHEEQLVPLGADWSSCCFGVLDARSVVDNTILLVSIDLHEESEENEGGQDDEVKGKGLRRVLSHRCDFGCSIDQLVFYNEGKITMQNNAEDLLDGEGVFTDERHLGMMRGFALDTHYKPANIRNLAVIGGLRESMLSANFANFFHGHAKPSSSASDGTSPTIEPKMHSMTLAINHKLIDPKSKTDQSVLLNWLDVPQHCNSLADTAAVLRVSDGALLFVELEEGVTLQTRKILAQTLAERVKPVLVINNIDWALLDRPISTADLYQSIRNIVDDLNLHIATHAHANFPFAAVEICPENGNMILCACQQGWGFSITEWAQIYAGKLGVDAKKTAKRLWGDNYYNPSTRKWQSSDVNEQGLTLERSFNQFILDPIFQIRDAVMDKNEEKLATILEKLHIKLSRKERTLTGEVLFHAIMKEFVPFAPALLRTAVLHLPSPEVAQKYRVECIYEGGMDDEAALGIRDCDPSGPLVCSIFKAIPSGERGRFHYLCRVLSGTLSTGPKYRFMGPNRGGRIGGILMGVNGSLNSVPSCSAGNLCRILGIENLVLQNTTITDGAQTATLKRMWLLNSHFVQATVDVREVQDLPQLLSALKDLSRLNAGIETWTAETGEHVVAANSDSHLKICLEELNRLIAPVLIRKSGPFISYSETVRMESSSVVMTKSPNKRNRLYVKAMPLDSEAMKAIDSGVIKSHYDPQTRARVIAEQLNWSESAAKKIWCFGPDNAGPNVLVEDTRGVMYVQEIKGGCVAGFQWATREGVLAEENMRGVQFNIVDVAMFSDYIRRGDGQILPTCRRVCHGAFLLADPAIQEPVFSVEVRCSEEHTRAVGDLLLRRRGHVYDRIPTPSPGILCLKANLPAADSLGFEKELLAMTNSRTSSQTAFDRWETMDSSPLVTNSVTWEIVRRIRSRKGLTLDIPPVAKFRDIL